jgi:hypothetical protein
MERGFVFGSLDPPAVAGRERREGPIPPPPAPVRGFPNGKGADRLMVMMFF